MKHFLTTVLLASYPIHFGEALAHGNDELASPRAEKYKIEAKLLHDTVIRFFEADSGYRHGDLIVQSQVAEIQDYLRRTQGTIRATHPKVLKRVLADNACLARAFYREKGRDLIRKTMEKVGGYAVLDQLCQSNAGRKILFDAIHDKDGQLLVSHVKNSAKQRAEASVPRSNRPNRFDRRSPKIYTVEDLVKAITTTLTR